MVRTWERVALKAFGVSTYRAEVESVGELTGWYRRITFRSPEFVELLPVFPTLWLRLWAPRSGAAAAVQRGYTLVDTDTDSGRFALDFVLHDAAGPAGDWARGVAVGDALEVALTPARPKAPAGTELYLLGGDVTALPAINSWLELLPAGVAVRAVIEDGHADRERLPVVARPAAGVEWVTPTDTDGSALCAALRRVETGGRSVYGWAAGEKSLVRSVRTTFRDGMGLGRSEYFAQSYWIRRS
ncbi:MAG TPA: siderophore-interacting protein [Pseudonocardia sp.]|nr:siderophore-interacting protein [Pseudonocardia sp.]